MNIDVHQWKKSRALLISRKFWSHEISRMFNQIQTFIGKSFQKYSVFLPGPVCCMWSKVVGQWSLVKRSQPREGSLLLRAESNFGVIKTLIRFKYLVSDIFSSHQTNNKQTFWTEATAVDAAELLIYFNNNIFVSRKNSGHNITPSF